MVNHKSIEKVHRIIDNLWEEEILFLKALGSYKSTLGNEKRIQSFIKKHLDDMNLQTTTFDPDPERLSKYENFGQPEWMYENRPVVVGEWKNEGDKIGQSLILQGHIDVVSAEPEDWWENDPYQPTIIDDKMYGRGICDMKSGIAAMIYAVHAIQRAGISLGADLQIQTVIEEECTGNGALALLDKGFVADGALIPEPTKLQAIKSQVGVLWVRVNVKGSGAHVEQADKAHNPINKATYLIQALEKYRLHINNRTKHPDFSDHPHPLNVSVGIINGGDWASNVPSECMFEARIGFYPGQDSKEIQEEVKQWLLEAAKQDEWLKGTPPEISFYGFRAPAFEASRHHKEIFEALEFAHQFTTNQALQKVAFTGTTDIRAFEEFGIPATCYGPSGEKMHAPNEYIDLNSLKTATKTIAAFVLEWCKEQK